jgi:tol-pal system protein YbgF
MKRALLPLLCLASGACVATQADVLQLQNQADNLKVQITDLKSTITSMQANQADLSVQMKQLHEDLTAFNETSKANQDQMNRLSSKLDDMSAGVKSSVASIGSTLTAQQAKSLEEQKAELAKQAEGGNPTELFNTADVRLQTKSFALAAKGFEEYAAKYPKGALIDVAYFKLGQSYFGERKWESAGRQFGTVLEKYPKSEMTASARLLYAMCLINMKKNLAEARQYLESIPNDFPTSPEAKAASRELKKMGKKGA